MIRPSWLTSVPAQLGSASHGKLKADQWRVLGTVFLPLSLIQLWQVVDTSNSNARAIRCARILDVTLSLLSAVAIALSHTTSYSHADAMQQHLLDYLHGLKELFPSYKFRPNHHMALHLPEYIKLYGPVHSWWAFPHERVIGMLQHISTNYKTGMCDSFSVLSVIVQLILGEYEATISCSFVRSSNLRNIFFRHGTPQVIRNCESIFQRLVHPKSRGTLVSDILQFNNHDNADSHDDSDIGPTIKHSSIPDELWKCIQTTLNSKAANLEPSSLSHITIGSRTYSTSTKHLGNSHILLKPRIPGQMIPARIDYITQVVVPGDSAVMYIAARKYLPLKLTNLNDPFRAHPCLQAELWSECLSELVLYPLNLIETHFASLPISWEGQLMMVVVSLKRVSIICSQLEFALFIYISIHRSCDHDIVTRTVQNGEV